MQEGLRAKSPAATCRSRPGGPWGCPSLPAGPFLSAAFGSGLLLLWSHGHGQQQDVAFSLLLSFGFLIVLLCSYVWISP